MATLYVVATPLGNKGDLSDRAKEILSTANYVFAEDTRTVKQLLSLYGIQMKGAAISYHAQSSAGKSSKIIELLKEDIVAALVTDAGTPAISDPGAGLIAQIREQLPECRMLPVPGPSAITTLLSVAGLPNHRFAFWGFVPLKKGRKTFFEALARSDIPVVFYESPHRIIKTLESLAELMPDKKMVVGREMTKFFEEYPGGTIAELYRYYSSNPGKIKGEFSCVVF